MRMLVSVLRTMVGEDMKKLLVLLLIPLGANAICLNKVDITGYGQDKPLASQDAKRKADIACDAGDLSWSVQKSEFTFTDLTNGENRYFSAKAQYQCCASW